MTGQGSERTVQVPEWFLSDLAPRIREIAELQVMLACFRLTAIKGIDQPLAEQALLEDRALNDSLRLEGATRAPADEIGRGIELAIARDALLAFTVADGYGQGQRWLLIATEQNRLKLHRYQSGSLAPPESSEFAEFQATISRSRPGIFRSYEQNIGLVTPIIADRLVEALELYPEEWIEDAIAAAVSYNKRNWRYIQRILETWATEGRSNEANRRHQSDTGDFDPERHLSGEYAHIFRRHRRN